MKLKFHFHKEWYTHLNKMQNVLIVEDEQSIIRVLKKILYDEFKFNIYEASDGTSAINLISKKKFELILCDIKMPNKNGIDVLEFCTKNSPDVPVVMISGHGDLPTAGKAMRLGAYDYISNPPDLNHLFKTIKSALNKKHHTRTINKKTLDLSVKNPNIFEKIDERTPEQIISEIEKLENASLESIKKIKELL